MAKTIAMPEPDADDSDLLRDYLASRDELAFRALVERHLPAVWSAARRMVNGDASLAEDIAQEVFAHLATHAPKLPPRVLLGGWLHRHTCFTARKALRTAARRRARELQHADAMNASADPWPDIAPHLDAALDSLPAADRDAVVLRFFEKRDFRAIAAALGTSEDAARMRTTRALEKLRTQLGKRSALLTVALLTSLLADKSIAAPPAGLAGQIAHASLSHAAAPAAGGIKTLLSWLRPHRAAIVGGGVLLLAGFVVWQWHDLLNAFERTSRAGAVSGAGNAKPIADPSNPGPPVMDLTVHFITMPEAKAAALMDARWNGDGDTDLLESLLKLASAKADGVQVAAALSRPCVSGQRVKLEKIKEFPYPTEFEPGEKGMITPTKFAFLNVGTTAEMELTVSEDGEFCDLNMALDHDYAEPELISWSTSLSERENKNLPAAKMPERRQTKVTAQAMLQPGMSGLVQCSQLPLLPDVPAQRLFVFITVTTP
jgi:RNA polymerase sigma factor (sigma-70 family)